MKRYATPLTLATLVLAFGAYIFFFERKGATTEELEARREHLFQDYHRERVDRIEVEHVTGRYELRRRGLDWVVVQGGQSRPAEAQEAERLVFEVESAQPTRRVGALDAATRARFGLERPRARVTLYEGPRASVRFSLGGAVSDEEAVYLESGGRAFVVQKSFGDAFDRGGNELRDRTLAELVVNRITALELTGAPGPRVLTRRGPVWSLTQPARGRASRGAVEALTSELDDLQATRILEDGVTAPSGLARYGLDRPTSRLAISRASGGPVVVLVGGPCPGHDGEFTVTREGSGTVGCIGRAFVDALQRDAEALRDDHVLSARADELSRVRLHGPAGDLVLRRDENGWSAEGGRTPVDADAVESWLGTLHDLAASDRLDEGALATHGLAQPSTTIEITRTGVEGPERINLGAADATGVYASRDDERIVLRFPPSSAETLLAEPIRFRPKRVIRDAQDDLQALLVEAGAFREEVARVDGRLRLTRPVGALVDLALTQDLAHQLANLDADRWVAATARPEHGLAAPRGRLVARFEGPGPREEASDAGADGGVPRVRSYTLTVGAEAPGGGLYAALEGTQGVFVVERSFWDGATAPHLDRGAVRLARDGAERLTLTPSSGPAVALRREGGHWRTDTGTPADDARVEETLDRLSNLIASRVVGYGSPPGEAGLGAFVVEVSRSGDGGARTERLELGAPTGSGESAGHYARRAGLDATFVLPTATVSALRALRP